MKADAITLTNGTDNPAYSDLSMAGLGGEITPYPS